MAKSSIVDQFGRPVDKAVLTQEIAGPTVSGIRTPYAGYPADGLTPPRLAAILREAVEGDPLRYFELAELIEERDLHYAGVLGTRKRSVAQIDIRVEAASDKAEDVRIADMIRGWLDRDELQDELVDILDAVGKGISFTEIIWDTSEGQWQPAQLEWRDPRWFIFDRNDGSTPLLRELGGDVPLKPFKFIQARIKAKSGLPIRSGLARIAAWAWMFKAYTQKDWAIFAQTFGQPVRVGKFGPGASAEDRNTLMRAVANIAGDCAAIIPESMLIEFIESKNVGQGSDLYEKRSDWLDRQMSKAVLGQTATTDAIAGGHAVGREHRQVQKDIEKADCKALSAKLNAGLTRPWVDLEFGPQKKYPRIVIEEPEETDVKMVVDAVEKLVPRGFRVKTAEFYDLLGLTEPKDGDEVLVAGNSDQKSEVGKEGENGSKSKTALQAQQPPAAPRDAVDDLADAAELLAQPGLTGMLDTIRALVDRAETLEDVGAGLLKLVPNMPADRLAETMRQALVMAELTGRGEIADGA